MVEGGVVCVCVCVWWCGMWYVYVCVCVCEGVCVRVCVEGGRGTRSRWLRHEVVPAGHGTWHM